MMIFSGRVAVCALAHLRRAEFTYIASARLKQLTEHLVGKLLEAGEMSLSEALFEIRSFEAA